MLRDLRKDDWDKNWNGNGLDWFERGLLDQLSRRMYNLSQSLAVAGALCASFDLGDMSARDTYWCRPTWRPGCKKDAAQYLESP